MTWNTAALDLETETHLATAYEALVTYNVALARDLGKALKKEGAPTTRQNYKGTGSKAHRRQLFVRYPGGAAIDLWVEGTHVRLGCIVCTGGKGVSPKGQKVDTLDDQGTRRPAEDVVREVCARLSTWILGEVL